MTKTVPGSEDKDKEKMANVGLAQWQSADSDKVGGDVFDSVTPRLAWLQPCGRLRREVYTMIIGDQQIDVEELRTWKLHPWFAAAVAALQSPLTTAELNWLLSLADTMGQASAMRCILFGKPVRVIDNEEWGKDSHERDVP